MKKRVKLYRSYVSLRKNVKGHSIELICLILLMLIAGVKTVSILDENISPTERSFNYRHYDYVSK